MKAVPKKPSASPNAAVARAPPVSSVPLVQVLDTRMVTAVMEQTIIVSMKFSPQPQVACLPGWSVFEEA